VRSADTNATDAATVAKFTEPTVSNVDIDVGYPRADLLPTEIQYNPSRLRAVNTIRFDSGVQNQGDRDTRVFNIRWLVDGQDVGAYGSHMGVPAGTTIYFESNEKNNCRHPHSMYRSLPLGVQTGETACR
jgi:hypothetical protein